MKNILLSKTVYLRETILKAVYLLQETFSFNISEDEYNYVLKMDSDIHFDEEKFLKLLNEQQLRETLNIQFGNLRDEIYHRAFSRFEGVK